MKREVALLVHLIALVTIGWAVIALVLAHPPGFELLVAGSLGFLAGVLTDAWVLRPLTDFTMSRARR